jgi:hypothetical protein
MKMIDPIQLDKSNLVVGFEVPILIDKIVSEIISNTHGVFVFAAPQGIGKSTYLKMAAIKLQLNHPNIKLKLIKNGGSVLQNQNLNILLKVPSGRALSDYLPNNSVIILDQIDFKSSLSENLRNYLSDLATDSHNSKKFKVVLCVSDPIVTKEILSCNEYEKIYLLCRCRSLSWTKTLIDQLIRIKLAKLPIEQMDKLKRLVDDSNNSPGLVVKAFSIIGSSSGKVEIDADEWKGLEKYSESCKSCWEEFKKPL